MAKIFHYIFTTYMHLVIGIRFPRLKEWAYAGFTFDLAGAIYASLQAGDTIAQTIPIFIGLVIVFGSYIFYHKKKTQ